MSWFVLSAVRVIEIAFMAIESRPATIAWLFDAAVHANTSFVMPALNRLRM